MSHDDFDPYHEWLGIEPSDHPVDHYRLLGVARFESDPRVIVQAADERMRLVRTFQTGPRGIHTQRLLNEISAARLRLLDPTSKTAYDDRLRAAPGPGTMDDPFLAGDEIVLPPVLESPEVDPMAPLIPSLADGSSGSAPTIQVAISSRPNDSVLPLRIDTNRTSRQVRGAPRSRSRHRSVWYVTTFVLGTSGIAAGVWFLGCLIFPRPAGPTAVVGRNSPSERSGINSGLITQDANGRFVLSAENATIRGATPRLTTSGTRRIIRDWQSSEDFLSWHVRIPRGTLFRARLTYAVDEVAADGSIRISIGDRSKEWDLRFGGGEGSFITDEFDLGVSQPGTHAVAIKAVAKPGREVMRFQQLELEPRRR